MKNFIYFITLLFFIFSSIVTYSEPQSYNDNKKNIPISTKWLLDAAGESGRSAIKSVYLIYCSKTNFKGTGFLLLNGPIITNEHVINGCVASDIIAKSSFGNKFYFKKLISDNFKDLAILIPKNKLNGGLTLGDDSNLKPGTIVSTWGFPLGYNGPAPLLSVGYLAGFTDNSSNTKTLKHLVVNGAFNPGNSGGPLFISNDDKVIGVVVSKHAPISNFHLSAIEALGNNRSGVTFTTSDSKGNEQTFVESQLVAGLLKYFRDLTQVMIGEAISVSELKSFLVEHNINLSE